MRQWVKIWVIESLTGTIRHDFTPEERCVWYELIILGGYCRQDGVIGAGEGKPYPDEYIAGLLNIPVELLRRTIKKCIKTGRLSRNGSGYKIEEWKKFQSEYDRQKPYRQKKKLEEQDPEKFTKGKYGHMVKR